MFLDSSQALPRTVGWGGACPFFDLATVSEAGVGTRPNCHVGLICSFAAIRYFDSPVVDRLFWDGQNVGNCGGGIL